MDLACLLATLSLSVILLGRSTSNVSASILNAEPASLMIGLVGKNAPSEFKEIAAEVASLHTALNQASNVQRNTNLILHRSSTDKKAELYKLLQRCEDCHGEHGGVVMCVYSRVCKCDGVVWGVVELIYTCGVRLPQ